MYAVVIANYPDLIQEFVVYQNSILVHNIDYITEILSKPLYQDSSVTVFRKNDIDGYDIYTQSSVQIDDFFEDNRIVYYCFIAKQPKKQIMIIKINENYEDYITRIPIPEEMQSELRVKIKTELRDKTLDSILPK